MSLFQNKYRNETCRYPGWNYANSGYYFVTICTRNRIRAFGKIIDKQIILSDLGLYAQRCWQNIPEHFPFVQLDTYIIMPDHIHGIIIIPPHYSVGTRVVGTQDFVSLQLQQNVSVHKHGNTFGPQTKNIGSIIRGFKIGVKKWTIEHNVCFSWQKLYYDRIIRNQQELQRIRQYIINNPRH